MKYDIIIVSYNSTRWLPACVNALAAVEYDKKELNLIIVDNNSPDQSVQLIEELQKQYTCFGGFELLRQKKNLGFGGGCNAGAAVGSAPFVFMLNVDTEIEPAAFTEMDRAIAANSGIAGAFEMRQKPYEAGRHNNPVTMECAWNSGACVVYRRTVYEEVGGFDENMFMYCEDVDISWRIRAKGYKLIYVPRAAVYHFTRRADKNKEFHEYTWTAYNKLLMHYKYGDFASIWQGNRDYLCTIRFPTHYDHVRKVLLKNYLKHFLHLWKFLGWRKKNRDSFDQIPATYIEGFEIMRSLYEYRPLKEHPLVSILVRTCDRPDVLRETLKCLRHQTYDNFEVVIEEDGEPTAQKMIEEEFSDLNISYEATGIRKGRCIAGNRALARAKGAYFNFLDDDDFFYPEHIEHLLSLFEQHKDADIVHGSYMIYDVDTLSKSPYVYEVKNIRFVPVERVDLFTMCKRCQTPILTAMFKRELYDKMGGLREDIDTNEDWGMWLRFLTLSPKYYPTSRATCGFVFPVNGAQSADKIASYRANYNKVFDDEKLVFELTGKELKDTYNRMLADIQHYRNIGTLDSYLHDNLQF